MNEEITITPEEIENKMKILVNLPQNRGLSQEELRKKAEDTLRSRKEKERDGTYIPGGTEIDVSDLFTDPAELKLAKVLLSKYLKEFSLETISDKALLKELIYLEVFQRVRLQKAAEDFQTKNKTVPLQILDSIHKNIDKIVSLKTSLGLLKDSTLKQNDSYQAFQTLIKKHEVWRKANQGTRSLVCDHCGKEIMLKIRTTAWEAQKHPFFQDRILGNTHLIKLYKEGKLTKEDLASIFETSPDYVSWLISKWKIDDRNN